MNKLGTSPFKDELTAGHIGEAGAGLAPDRETELRIRAQLDEKARREKEMENEAKKRRKSVRTRTA